MQQCREVHDISERPLSHASFRIYHCLCKRIVMRTIYLVVAEEEPRPSPSLSSHLASAHQCIHQSILYQKY